MKKNITNLGYKKFLHSLEEFPEKQYKKMDLDRLAIYSMALLSENNIPLYFDYIVIALFKLFPKKFSLVNFEEYPDSDRVEKILLHLKPRDRNWATGNVREGYCLTETGKEIVKQAKDLLRFPDKQKHQIFVPIIKTRTATPEKEIEDIRLSELYKEWKRGDIKKIGEYDIWACLHAVSYAPKALLKRHINNLKQAAEEIKDKKVIEFLQWVENKYKNIFRD